MSEAKQKRENIVQGRVVSDKMDKTRVILVETVRTHPYLSKPMRRSRRVKIHDEKNECKSGDLVQAIETRPLSADKRHRLLKIIEKAEAEA
ncbi:MAG: 30S ribosomal protein S17 [Leptospirales bacterium]|nr:30S ribosomal protein S17 [Leptospirales bacterium]